MFQSLHSFWSMEGYLRGYYGYKNFGDELLFFGVVRQLFAKYPLTKLFIEVEDTSWMEDWIRENYQWILTEKQLKAIKLIKSTTHRYKIIWYLKQCFGQKKYNKTFKFFGWGEVFSDERAFPHDGRNIPLFFNQSVKTGKFVLLWWIGKIRKPWTEMLYRHVLPKAEKIIVRDRDSFQIAKKFNPENTVMQQDFAQEIIMNAECKMQNAEWKNKQKYILININKQSITKENIQKIIDFCTQYPNHKKIFFPCDIKNDKRYFLLIKKYISDVEEYDWTTHSLSQSLSLFYYADGGIWSRLHFLLPLKLYDKPIVAIPYADKINKVIINNKTKI